MEETEHTGTAYTSFLGTGWRFPPSFSNKKKGVIMISDEEDIRSSLEILLSTTVGERFLQPKYGCNLDHMVFEPMNTGMQTYVLGLVKQAILHFEPRINLENISLDTSGELEGRLDINIEYKIRTTNTRYNFVYPFYINELNKS